LTPQTLPFGTKRTYHALNIDWITNEIFRRVEPEGRTMGEYWREEVQSQLDLDIFFNMDDEEVLRCHDAVFHPSLKTVWDVVRPKGEHNLA